MLIVLILATCSIVQSETGVKGNDVHNTSRAKKIPPNVDPELILTLEEKIAFEKFRAAVHPNINNVAWIKPYLLNDLYLLRWIRSKKLDVPAAVQDFKQFLDFLRVNNIKGILKENWSEMDAEFPFHLDVFDKWGRPVGYVYAQEGWNIRRGILQGKRQLMVRYIYKIVFQVLTKIMEVNRKQSNVTQGVFIFNLDGFSVVEHSCTQCVSTYLTLLDVYEKYIPGFVKEIIIINAPQAFVILLEILRPVLSPNTRNSLHVMNTNRNYWKSYLDARIDAHQLPFELGGTRVD